MDDATREAFAVLAAHKARLVMTPGITGGPANAPSIQVRKALTAGADPVALYKAALAAGAVDTVMQWVAVIGSLGASGPANNVAAFLLALDADAVVSAQVDAAQATARQIEAGAQTRAAGVLADAQTRRDAIVRDAMRAAGAIGTVDEAAERVATIQAERDRASVTRDRLRDECSELDEKIESRAVRLAASASQERAEQALANAEAALMDDGGAERGAALVALATETRLHAGWVRDGRAQRTPPRPRDIGGP